MEFRDYYQILGVTRQATVDEIKKAFRRMNRDAAGARNRGGDHHAKVLLDLEDAYQGASRTLTLRTPHVDEQGRAGLVADLLDEVQRLRARLRRAGLSAD